MHNTKVAGSACQAGNVSQAAQQQHAAALACLAVKAAIFVA
jgi:hypothetical protein